MLLRPAQQKKPKRIAVVGLPRLQRVLGLHNLILSELFEDLGWNVVLSAEAYPGAIKAIQEMDCDGAIVRVVSEQLRREAQVVKCPLVNISAWLEDSGLPSVVPNGREMGRLAVEHLRARRYRSFGCVIREESWMFSSVLDGVEDAVRSFGGDLQVFHDRDAWGQADVGGGGPEQPKQLFQQWVRQLKLPAAMVLVDDANAAQLMDACREIGLSIPADLSVISATYHQEYSEHCVPSLTSVRHDDRAMLVAAIKMLQELLDGRQPPRERLLIPPSGVVPRDSTAFLAVGDRRISRALEFIHTNYHRVLLSGEEIAECAGLSRSVLGRYFKAETGSSVHDYVVALRMHKASELLEAPKPPPLQSIASQCGFSDRKEMNRVFRRLTGGRPRPLAFHPDYDATSAVER